MRHFVAPPSLCCCRRRRRAGEDRSRLPPPSRSRASRPSRSLLPTASPVRAVSPGADAGLESRETPDAGHHGTRGRPADSLRRRARRDRRQMTLVSSRACHAGRAPHSILPTVIPSCFSTILPGASCDPVSVRHDHRRDHAGRGVKTRYHHVWSRQGKWLAFDSSERNGKDRDLYVMQPSDPKTKRLLAQVEGPFNPHDWSPDGNGCSRTRSSATRNGISGSST